MKFGTVLPHRSPDQIDPGTVMAVAARAEALGFADVWVTDNTLDVVYSFDPFVVLSYAAASTSRVRLGTSMLVLPLHDPRRVAHQAASIDVLSNGRLLLGVALGRIHDYLEFQVPADRRVRRFVEAIHLMRELWANPRTTFFGDIYEVDDVPMRLTPVQDPLPIWLGGRHPSAIQRAAMYGDGWMAAGASSLEDFSESVALLCHSLEAIGRNPSTFGFSKRVFMYVADTETEARRRVHHWYSTVYNDGNKTDDQGVFGTVEQVAEKLAMFIDVGADHLLLNSVADYLDQLDASTELMRILGAV